MRHCYRSILSLWSLAFGLAATAGAGNLEVAVRERGGEPVSRETVVLQILSSGGTRSYPARRSMRLSAFTDSQGIAAFSGLRPGSYAVTLPQLRHRELLRPSENPFAPPPRVTFFDENEDLRVDVELWRGVSASVYLDVSDDRTDGFAALFEHRATGRSLRAAFSRHANFVERLLVPGVWDVSVAPRPGYLLVDVSHDRLPVAGASVRLDLAQDPRETYLQFTYAALAELSGKVVEETGKRPAVEIEAVLVEPGPWFDAVRRRGGSVYERVAAAVDADTGDYHMVLPDGVWQVRPVSPHLAASKPETIPVDLAPGGAGRADFTILLEGGRVGDDPLVVSVRSPRYVPLAGAPVEVYADGGDGERVREGTTGRYGQLLLPALEDGSYRVVAGHPDYLEGTVALPDVGHQEGPVRASVTLPAGAEIRVEASGRDQGPLADVEVTVERVGDPPDVQLQDPDFLEAKMERTLTTDQSGRAALQGFYPGTYRARADLRGQGGTGAFVDLSAGGDFAPRIEFEIAGDERIELVARQLPAVSWTASLVCADPRWALPDAADVRVFDALADLAGLDLDDEPDPQAGQVLALGGAILGGRHRDLLTIGPLERGVYRLAVRPAGFERWTWAYETTDPEEAVEVRAVPGDGDAPTSLGDFQVECAPAVDLLPAVASGSPFPRLQQVDVEARVVDPENGHEAGEEPVVRRRRGRFELRGLPRGTIRLEFTFTHPHFLPVPSQSWRVDLELDRGAFREVVAQVEAVGGALVVEGAGAWARLQGPGGELREASFRDRKAEIPSLVPGLYRLEIVDDGGTVVREWEEIEVRGGETVRVGPAP